MRVDVKPELLRWARKRAGITIDSLAQKFPKYSKWESGEVLPTLRQLEKFSNTVHASIGYFYLSSPPELPLPIPDFRTVGNITLQHPSPDLLDTLYLCQQRQFWYQDFARMEGESRLEFIGSANLENDVEMVAEEIRNSLLFDLEERCDLPNWSEALGYFIEKTDSLGILVMVSGIVGNNVHRKLNPGEFRGFSFADDFAPLIFINGADTKAIQMFTLAHELAHLWLGESALSDSSPDTFSAWETEMWCNHVAAEILVPRAVLREEYREDEELDFSLERLAHRFKVSTLVVLRRVYDLGKLDPDTFQSAYKDQLDILPTPTSGGGNFYSTLKASAGYRFGHALVVSTLEGHTSFTESFRLLGIKKITTFRKLADSLGVEQQNSLSPVHK